MAGGRHAHADSLQPLKHGKGRVGTTTTLQSAKSANRNGAKWLPWPPQRSKAPAKPAALEQCGGCQAAHLPLPQPKQGRPARQGTPEGAEAQADSTGKRERRGPPPTNASEAPAVSASPTPTAVRTGPPSLVAGPARHPASPRPGPPRVIRLDAARSAAPTSRYQCTPRVARTNARCSAVCCSGCFFLSSPSGNSL